MVRIPPQTPAEHVAHFVRLWHRGVICAGEMWNQIHDLFAESGIEAGLEACGEETRNLVSATFQGYPWTADSLPHETPERKAIRQWYEQRGKQHG